MPQITINNGQDFVDRLKRRKQVFSLEITNSTTKIIWAGATYKYSSSKGLKNKELGFIKQVLNYCSKNIAPIPSKKEHIKYIRHGKIKKGYIYKKDIYEIDLNQAYWNYAFKQGYISKEIYQKGMRVSKMCRLMSLGNLAKRTVTLNFNGEIFEPMSEPVGSPLTEGIFFDVAFLTDVAMNKLIHLAGDNYLFYWVDAIFIQGEETLEKIKWFLKEYDLQFKVKNIYSIQKKEGVIVVKDTKYSRKDSEIKEEKKGYREFNFQKSTKIILKHDYNPEAEQNEIETRNTFDTATIQDFLSQKRTPEDIELERRGETT